MYLAAAETELLTRSPVMASPSTLGRGPAFPLLKAVDRRLPFVLAQPNREENQRTNESADAEIKVLHTR